MPANLPGLGVGTVSVQEDLASGNGPSLSAATVAVSCITPTRYVRSSNQKVVGGNGTYKVALATFGIDRTNGGYTFGIASAVSTGQIPTTGQGILVRLAASNYATLTGIDQSIGLAIVIQKGSATPQLLNVGIIDTSQDFSYLIMEEANPAATKITTGELAAAPTPANKNHGDRNPGLNIWTPFKTTGGVRRRHRTTTITVSPDDSVDYPVVTARAVDLEFNVLSDSLDDLMGAGAGNFTYYTDTNSQLVTQGSADMYTTTANISGNKAIQYAMPNRTDGSFIQCMHIGNVINNQQEWTEERRKTEASSIPYILSAASIDRLLVGIMTGSYQIRQ